MIEMVIDARRKDLGGFEVGRILPFHQRRMVGPFIFLDHAGPVRFAPDVGRRADVRPHPHVGLSTVSYLLSGGEYDLDDATPVALQPGTCTKGPLLIGEDCWIGAGAKVLDGASLGDHCVIGAGSVVNRPIPANSIAVGVPARVVKSRKTAE